MNVCGKLCKCCRTCKHCEEYTALDYEYMCPEPAFRCKAKNSEILIVGLPRPFCDSFEAKGEVSKILLSVPKDEMLDTERNVRRLAKAFSDMGCSAEEAMESLKKLQLTRSQEEINTYLIDTLDVTSKPVLVHKPKSTNCPNCGAPVDIHAEKCAYCDTPYI